MKPNKLSLSVVYSLLIVNTLIAVTSSSTLEQSLKTELYNRALDSNWFVTSRT